MSDFGIYNNLPRIMPSPSGIKPPSAAPDANKNDGETFGGALKDAINQVSQLQTGTQNELTKFMNNESDLHSVMIAIEKADLSFQMMMQVRNKIVNAYQEIMKTQV
jgi:flagellar hook-basal body complex protein FliE